MFPLLKAGALALLFCLDGCDAAAVRALVEEDLLYHPRKEEIMQVIECESGFDPAALGDRGKSVGLVQINLPSHPNVTLEEALDWRFSLEFIKDNFRAGREEMWTCYHKMIQETARAR